MKLIHKNYLTLLIALVIFSISAISCSSNNDNLEITNTDEASGLIKIQEFSNDNHTFYLYTKNGKLMMGYNEIFIQIKNRSTGEYESNASLSWHPIMHMTSKSHSCPYGNIEKAPGKQTLFKGFIIFQMASNDSEYWELSLDYYINDQRAQISETLNVITSTQKTMQNFTGSDNIKYFAALTQPSSPNVGSNDITAYLYKMEDMNTFVPVDNYTIKIDPRMPGMGNHSSPNNQNLTYTGTPGYYKGKVSLTMTGYWKINLIVHDSSSQIIKGETVTESNESSSIFWEIEF